MFSLSTASKCLAKAVRQFDNSVAAALRSVLDTLVIEGKMRIQPEMLLTYLAWCSGHLCYKMTIR